jgi:hypothetical protein
MAIEEIPKAYRYTCEGCGAYCTQQNASRHYTNSTPPHWLTVRVSFNDQHGFEKLFCDECSGPVLVMLRTWKGKTSR